MVQLHRQAGFRHGFLYAEHIVDVKKYLLHELRTFAADSITRHVFYLVVEVHAVAAVKMHPYRLKGISRVVFVLLEAVENNGFSRVSGAVLSVLYISERAADDMRYEKAVVVVSDEVVSVHGKKMPRAYGIQIQSFRVLRRGEEIQLRRFQYSFFC